MAPCNAVTSDLNQNKTEIPRLTHPKPSIMLIKQMISPQEGRTMDLNLEPGTHVNIQRSDGRIHPALVYDINWEARSVAVEWQEQNETKGKEVDMDAVIALNPSIVKVSRKSDINTSTRLKTERIESIKEPIKVPETPNIERKLIAPKPAQQVNHPLTRNATRQSIPVSNRNVPLKKQTTMRYTTSSMSTNALNEQDRRENVPPVAAVAPVAPVAPRLNPPVTRGGGRKSNVVKEVEKLKKNREERRLRQAEEKAEKEAFLQQAPGNPYWEFLNMVNEYQRSIEFRPLSANDSVEDHQITVCVRKRPLNKREISRKEIDVIAVPSKDTVIVHEPKNKVDLTRYLENQLFRFDYAFNETCSNELVYKFTAQPLVKTVFEGGMATCFAYGQTGSGKTHTMGGDFNGKTQDCQKGIYALVAKDVFEYLKNPKYKKMHFVVSASFFEIYSGKVFDLLANKAKLRILEDAKQQVQVVGLTEKVVSSRDEVLKLIQHGNMARTSGQTSANSNSSRSHAIFQICIRTPGITKIYGKFSLIDLAGNERGADTSSANRQIRMEGAEINKSLLALKECIRALGRKGGHLPFRASKLTQVLRDSFIGEKSRTCMIAMISPGVASCEHTLNTLRYADRVKELAVVDPAIGADVEDDFNNADCLQITSLNKNDISEELINFHQAISELQICEEEMLDKHKTVNEFLKTALESSSILYTTANNVEYDQEAYCTHWEDVLSKAIDVFSEARSKVQEYRNKLLTEEQLSRKMKP